VESVRKYQGEMVGRKQDKAGHWRKAKVPNYAGDQRLAYEIDNRLKALKMWDRYSKELTKITAPKKLPPEWASPEQVPGCTKGDESPLSSGGPLQKRLSGELAKLPLE
jgi:hypothetical protein